MRSIARIMKTELKVLFFSPVAWMLLVIFSIQVGLEYLTSIDAVFRNDLLGYPPSKLTMSIFGGYFGVVSKVMKHLYLYIPLLTMGLMSRELSSGSIKLLYSSPVSNAKIIIGKYLAAALYCLMLVLILAIPMVITVFSIKSPDIPFMLTSLLGVYLTVLVYAAIGLFMSTLTRYQVVAAAGTLAVLIGLNSVGNLWTDVEYLREATSWLSIMNRSSNFTDGMICTSDLLYFILMTVLFLALAVITLNGERLKQSKSAIYARYAAVVAITLSLGVLSSAPLFTKYYDATRTKVNTLTEESRKVMEALDGKITITSYVNLFDKTYNQGSPETVISDRKKFARYSRFNPYIKFKYVYYYGPGSDYERYKELNPGLDGEALMKRVCQYRDIKPDFLSFEQVNEMADLTMEKGRLVRILESSDGATSRLRIYEDDYRDPFEEQMTAAFKALVVKSPVAGFVTGHGERDKDDFSEKGYGTFATDIAYRYSLVNNGFEFRNIVLNEAVSPDVDILVIADVKTAFSEKEMENYRAYVERGGNLFILGEPRRQNNMNPLLKEVGLEFESGQVVMPSEQYEANMIALTPDEAVRGKFRYLNVVRQKGYSIVTPSACAINQLDDTKKFRKVDILRTPMSGSWVEKQTEDFVNDTATVDYLAGESEGVNVVMTYLSRQIKAKEQRVFVIGDADCISTLELSTQRPGFANGNFNLITEVFSTLSYGQYPVYAERPKQPDNELYLTKRTLPIVKYILAGLIPAALLACGITVLIRRKRR